MSGTNNINWGGSGLRYKPNLTSIDVLNDMTRYGANNAYVDPMSLAFGSGYGGGSGVGLGGATGSLGFNAGGAVSGLDKFMAPDAFKMGTVPGAEKIDWMGLGGMALQGMGNIGSMFLDMKGYGLAKKALKENMRQFNRNFEAQQKTLNTAMEDRQNSRVAANPNQHVPTDEYMRKNRI